jgi:hypothetical protein
VRTTGSQLIAEEAKLKHRRCRAFDHIVGLRGDCIVCEHTVLDGVALPWDDCPDECDEAWAEERQLEASKR